MLNPVGPPCIIIPIRESTPVARYQSQTHLTQNDANSLDKLRSTAATRRSVCIYPLLGVNVWGGADVRAKSDLQCTCFVESRPQWLESMWTSVTYVVAFYRQVFLRSWLDDRIIFSESGFSSDCHVNGSLNLDPNIFQPKNSCSSPKIRTRDGRGEEG